MDYYGYVYRTTNILNNKVYIGVKRSEFDPNYLGSGKILKKAILKNGKDNFKVEFITYAKDKQKLNELEKQYIKEHRYKFGKRNVYNIVDGGIGGGHFNKHTEETKRKISEKLQVVMNSIKTQEKLRKRIVSKNTKQKISSTLKKRYENDNYREKISIKTKEAMTNRFRKYKDDGSFTWELKNGLCII